MTHCRTLVFAMSLICLPSNVLSQNVRLEWPSELTLEDRRDVLALAKQMGIDELARVEVTLFGHRDLSLESGPAEIGLEVHSTRAAMFRDYWLGHDNTERADAGPYRVGRWTSAGPPEAVIRWRIYDGDWFTDVHLWSADEYDDARTIVTAFRQGTLVNRQPDVVSDGVRSQPPIPAIELPRLGSISRPLNDRLSRDLFRVREYMVFWGSFGYNIDGLHVRIVDDTVEFLGVVHSIA